METHFVIERVGDPASMMQRVYNNGNFELPDFIREWFEVHADDWVIVHPLMGPLPHRESDDGSPMAFPTKALADAYLETVLVERDRKMEELGGEEAVGRLADALRKVLDPPKMQVIYLDQEQLDGLLDLLSGTDGEGDDEEDEQ